MGLCRMPHSVAYRGRVSKLHRKPSSCSERRYGAAGPRSRCKGGVCKGQATTRPPNAQREDTVIHYTYTDEDTGEQWREELHDGGDYMYYIEEMYRTAGGKQYFHDEEA